MNRLENATAMKPSAEVHSLRFLEAPAFGSRDWLSRRVPQFRFHPGEQTPERSSSVCQEPGECGSTRAFDLCITQLFSRIPMQDGSAVRT